MNETETRAELIVDTYHYFGEPVYIYSLKDGTDDGFLTPFNLGEVANISSLFIEFQKYLYMKQSA